MRPPAERHQPLSPDDSIYPFRDTDPATERYVERRPRISSTLSRPTAIAPGEDEPNPRPMPQRATTQGRLDAMVEAISGMREASDAYRGARKIPTAAPC